MTFVDDAHAAGRCFTATLTRDAQRAMGQYMTPPAIARFMAQRLVADVQLDHVRVLEPSAGCGILAAATVEALLAKQPEHRPNLIDLYLFELDARLVPRLEALCHQMERACTAVGVVLDWKIAQEDFLLSELALRGQTVEGLLTISNPPFLKLNKTTDQRAHLHSYAVYGQPNIYALFMAATARLTPAGGKWCFITPRSWMAGQYFKAARRAVLSHLTIDSLHAFENRKEGFEEDSVLQETVIAWASGRQLFDPGANILLTRSQGAKDLDSSKVTAFPTERVVGGDECAMLSLPHGERSLFDGWTSTLKTYGLQVSTGPVVAFRAAMHIREVSTSFSVPLLWLQHVKQQDIKWPIYKKREHIEANASSAWMLVPNAPMVLMRRFSPKEDARRVTCAAYVGELPGAVLGLENHLNYIYRPGGRMSCEEARGLSAFLASSLVDAHFRSLAGSTQVNATELRKLPLPPLAVIEEIGRTICARPTLSEIDEVVTHVLESEKAARDVA